ncbi:uncharacterized protein K452DRAFT_319846, partial [Aplosporella prunicola CBS 121167]
MSIAAIRRYSSGTYIRGCPATRLQLLVANCAITAGVVLPFVPPYMQTRKAKKDGSYLT